MLNIPGYHVGEPLVPAGKRMLFAGTRASDGRGVIVKLYARDENRPLPATRAFREFSILRGIGAPGVVRALGLEQTNGTTVLILERSAGLPLPALQRESGPDIEACLRIAHGIARALEAVHAARVLHMDVQPHGVVVDPLTLDTCLVDFGLADEIGCVPRSAGDDAADGALAYMAPERSGRIGADLDFRSDLYSLGVTLYELFTGVLPFECKSSVELINAHLAMVPAAPSALARRTPEMISRVVLRLLEKDPERRYQSAYGVRSDLEECLRRLGPDANVAPLFVLGEHDGSDRLRFPRVCSGRARERAELLGALQRVLEGGVELVLLSGPAGIGKSSLPETLRPRLRQSGGYLAQGKFDVARNRAARGGIEALFGSLLDQMLAESSDRFGYWRDQLRSGLGTIAGALLPLVPDLEAIVDPLPALPPLAPREARQRLRLAVERFVATLAIRGRGLVLVLDDLQWADPGSLDLLAAILQSKPPSLLVVGTLRDGAEARRVRGWIEQIAAHVRAEEVVVGPLSVDDAQVFLAEVLHRAPEDTRRLAELVALKTGNNPLQIRQLLIELRERGVLRYVHGEGWHWDARELAELGVMDDVAGSLVKRLGALPERARAVVGLASLIGDAFDVEYLSALSSMDRTDLLQLLSELSDHGILAPCRQGFRFTHDRIREAARALLSEQEAARLHREAARMLLAQTPPHQLDVRAAEIADHLHAAADALEESDRGPALDASFRAGVRALEECAPLSAQQYLERARSLAGERIWESRRELGFEIHLSLAESLLQSGEFERCLELLDRIEAHGWDVVRSARLDAKRLSVGVLREGPDQLARPALAVLRKYGMSLPARPGRLRARAVVAWTDWRLRGGYTKQGVASRSKAPDALRQAQTIVALVVGPILATSGRLYLYLCARRLRSFLRYGAPALEWAALALIGYAITRMEVARTFRPSARYAEIALAWWSAKPDSPARWIGHYMVEGFLRPPIHGHRKAIAPLQEISRKLLELGNLEFRAYAVFNGAVHAALAGAPLTDVEAELASLPDAEGREFLPTRWVLRALRLLRSPADEAHGREIAEIDQAIRSRRWDRYGPTAIWLMVLATLGRFEEIVSAETGPRPSTHQAFQLDMYFYTALAACAVAPTRGARDRRRLCRLVRRCERAIERGARVNRDLRHLLLGLRAELRQLDGDAAGALAAFGEAAAAARSAGYVNHAALVLERKLSLLRALGRRVEADLARDECAALYEVWGVPPKAEQVRSAQLWS
jgi:hypothetical protein